MFGKRKILKTSLIVFIKGILLALFYCGMGAVKRFLSRIISEGEQLMLLKRNITLLMVNSD
ncbi:hypothetical protein RSA31_00260 [Pantoea dispersa]|nr:hypothetical protein NS215_06560 [Pantoea dispersa]KTS89442.1 hypothetical protein RSA31_00260 [Pantoea dispersa]